jgi:hypothetical protein
MMLKQLPVCRPLPSAVSGLSGRTGTYRIWVPQGTSSLSVSTEAREGVQQLLLGHRSWAQFNEKNGELQADASTFDYSVRFLGPVSGFLHAIDNSCYIT